MDDLKAGNAEEDKNHWIEMLDKVPRLSVILANEVFSNNYYALEHWSEIQRSRFSLIILQKLQEFLGNTDGNNRITIDELYGYVVTELKREKADLKPWKWDPGDKLGPTELMRVNKTAAPLSTVVQNSNSDAGLKNGKFKQKKCFVISPLKGKRAEWVLKHVIDRGCLRAGYEAKRSDHLLTAEIMPTVIRELRESPMTVAYLGPTEGQWSPNVMIEVGFRLATNKPIVLLREEPLENEEPLPFDIKDRRTIYLPRQQAEVKQDLEKTIEDVAESIRFLEESGEKPSNWNSDHPIAKLSFKIGKGSGTFLESSPAADALFAKAGIEGGLCTVELSEFISSLQAAMHPAQGEAFFEEQDKLIGKMFGPFWKVAKDKMPVATVPIIFSGDANRKAYLPIIVEHSQEGEDILLRILYLDVSGKLSESLWAQERISVCNLRGYDSKTTVAAMTS
jgi:hypothetical protein